MRICKLNIFEWFACKINIKTKSTLEKKKYRKPNFFSVAAYKCLSIFLIQNIYFLHSIITHSRLCVI